MLFRSDVAMIVAEPGDVTVALRGGLTTVSSDEVSDSMRAPLIGKRNIADTPGAEVWLPML